MDGFLCSVLRTTCCTALGALIATILLREKRRTLSPAIHRFVWCLVLVQGWAYFPFALALPFIYLDSHSTATSKTVADVQPSVSFVAGGAISGGAVAVEPTEMLGLSKWMARAWLVGVIAIILYYAQQYRELIANVPLGRKPTKPEWVAEWNRISHDVGVGKRTHFSLSDELGPLCCFVPYFYLVVTPERLWSSLDAWQRECVLRHELAHIVRRDLWKAILVRILALPQWFNPIAWKAVRAFDDAAEWACDDFVMNSCGRSFSSSYPATLLKIAEYAFTPLPSSLAVQGGQLTTRIRRLVQPRFKEENAMKKMSIPFVLFGLFAFQSIRLVAVETSEQQSVAQVPELEAANVPGSLVNTQTPESREAALERTGLNPYRVEPSDILQMTVTSAGGDRTLGKHLVGPDGSISLGVMGSVDVAGKTIADITELVSARFVEKGSRDRVAFDVFAYNSKVYYVIIESTSSAPTAIRFPVTGNETVLDALAQDGEWKKLPTEHIWVSRPNPDKEMPPTILTVDWQALCSGDTATNHQILPGDRIFVAERGPNETSLTPGAYQSGPPLSPAAAAGPPPTLGQVAIECKIIEIAADGTLSLHDLVSTSVDDDSEDVCVLNQQALKALRKELSKHETVETICAPKTVTMSGRSVIVNIGEELEVAFPPGNEHEAFVETIQIGTMLDIRPTTIGQARVRLDVSLKTRHVNDQKTVVVDGHRVPGFRVSSISRTVDLNAGENVVALMRSTSPTKEEAGSNYVLAIAHAELVADAERAVQPTPAISSQSLPKRTPVP